MQTMNQNMEYIVVVTSCCFWWYHLGGWSFSDCLHCWKNVACRRPPKLVWVVGSETHPYLEVSVNPGPGQKHRSKLFSTVCHMKMTSGIMFLSLKECCLFNMSTCVARLREDKQVCTLEHIFSTPRFQKQTGILTFKDSGCLWVLWYNFSQWFSKQHN